MICWYCHWGWPKPVADIFIAARDELGDDYFLRFGPGHIVWEDENWDSAQWCLDNFEAYRRDMPDKEAAIVKRSLEQLAALPESAWNVEPADYDEMHPENYPPPPGIEMVRV